MLPYPQLTGSPRIVYDALKQHMVDDASIYSLSDATGYHPITVHRALRQLQAEGLIVIIPQGRGRRSLYELCE